jgi:hypothetical protein
MLKIVALCAAFILALSGVSVGATIGESAGAGNPKQASTLRDDQAKAKKCKKKAKKKCRKKGSGKASTNGEFVPGRVVEIMYTGSALGSPDTPATIYPTGPVFPVNFVAGAGEVLAMIEIVDDVGPNASSGFSYDSDGDGLNDTGFDVCGSTEEPVEVIPGTQYNIFPYLVPSTGCTDAVATSGTITVTFNKV